MEDMLSQILLELKSLNEVVKRVDDRIKRLECSGQALAEVGRHFEENSEIENKNVYISSLESLEHIWRKVLDITKKELTEISFKTWLEIIRPLSIDEDVIHLRVLSEFEKSIIECRYIELLKTALRNITNKAFEIELSVAGDAEKKWVLNNGLTTKADKKWPSFNPRYSFSTFVVGEHNKSAYKHVFEVSKNPYNQGKLLYIYGGVGTGKTHLIQAAGNYMSEHYPDAKVRYITIDDFINEMIEAIRGDNSIGFKEKLSGYDVLIIDNLQFITGKDATQAEFLKIVSELLERGKLVIITSTKSPQDMKIMNERFTSMFELGGVFEIKRPDLDTRLEILRRRRAEGNFELSDEELNIIAGSTSDNIRELLNVFNRFGAYGEMTGEQMVMNG